MANWFHRLQDKVGIDKISHFMAGFIVTSLMSGLKFELTICGAFVALLVGVNKELFLDDSIDSQDIIATFLGGLFGAMVFALREMVFGF